MLHNLNTPQDVTYNSRMMTKIINEAVRRGRWAALSLSYRRWKQHSTPALSRPVLQQKTVRAVSLTFGVGQGFALFQRYVGGNLALMITQQARQAKHNALPSNDAGLLPRGKGLLCIFRGGIHFFGRSARRT